MAKAFFRQNPTSLTWEYGDFKADGITPKTEYTIPAGLYRARWETINDVVHLTLVNANNLGELNPIRNIPITEVAKDLIGTAYADRAEFETANYGFFNIMNLDSQPEYIDSTFTITRPANATAYSDGDAILDVVGIATQKFPNVAKSAGRGVNFINLVAFTNDTGLAGKTINVVFYKQSPSSPISDNSAFSYSSANELIRKGTVQLTFGTGTLAGVAQLGIDSTSGIMNVSLNPTNKDVYCQVWLPVGYTPSANSTYIILKASLIQN